MHVLLERVSTGRNAGHAGKEILFQHKIRPMVKKKKKNSFFFPQIQLVTCAEQESLTYC